MSINCKRLKIFSMLMFLIGVAYIARGIHVLVCNIGDIPPCGFLAMLKSCLTRQQMITLSGTCMIVWGTIAFILFGLGVCGANKPSKVKLFCRFAIFALVAQAFAAVGSVMSSNFFISLNQSLSNLNLLIFAFLTGFALYFAYNVKAENER